MYASHDPGSGASDQYEWFMVHLTAEMGRPSGRFYSPPCEGRAARHVMGERDVEGR